MTADTPGRVVVVGAGLMGAQIGLEYALVGARVTLVTRSVASRPRAVARVRAAATTLVRLGLVSSDECDAALDRIATLDGDAVEFAAADLIVESVSEDFDAKVAVLAKAARANEGATLATNTSSLSIEALGDAAGAPERVLGTHYWNPPTLMPLVEIAAGPKTDPTRVAAVEATLRRLGKIPLRVPDITGFVWNRLMLALIREAVALVRDAGVSPETIDEIAQRGFGRRWSVIGPFASMAAGGQATVAAVADLIYPALDCAQDGRGVRALRLTTDARLADAIGRRDEVLARLLLVERARRDAGEFA